MFNDLILSYKNTISTMDLNLVRPFTETEIQPIYSKEWIKLMGKIIDVCKQKNISNADIIKDFPNISTIRSMLIMDIFDLYYSNSERNTIKKIISFYNDLLNASYNEDKFSLYSNKPIHMERYIQDNGRTYINEAKDKKEYNDISLYCFLMAFEIFQDIFSDNCYEVMGPFKEKGKIFIVKEFHNILSNKFTNIRIIEIHNINDISGNEKIDLFAHSTFESKKCKLVVEVDNKIYKGDINSILDIIKGITFKHRAINKKHTISENKNEHLKNRLFRYYKLLEKLNMHIDTKSIYEKLDISFLYPRNYDKEDLVNIISETLKKGSFND